MLSDRPGIKLNQYVSDYVIFDLETTGISCAYDAIVEIAAVKVSGGKITDSFSTLVNPERPIPYGASRVNGIYDEMVQDCPVIETALGGFLDFVEDRILVGHNIHAFDMKFIKRDATRLWGKTVGNDYIDTLAIARQYLPGLAHHRLSDLAVYYGISAEGAHRALADCKMNYHVFEQLGREMQTPQTEIKLCPRCRRPLKKRNGKFGLFWGCSGYPECRYTENIRD